MWQDGQRIAYRSRRVLGGHPRTYALFEPVEAPGASEPGTLEHFLIERYLLYVRRRGRLWRGQVYHTPYPVQRAHLLAWRDELIGAAGLPQPTSPPPLAHSSPGVDVEIFGLMPA